MLVKHMWQSAKRYHCHENKKELDSLTNLNISSSSSTWRFQPVQTSNHACFTVSWPSVHSRKGSTLLIWAWYIAIISSMMDHVNSSKSAVQMQPWEPLPSTLIFLVTTVVSVEVVARVSFHFLSGVSFWIISGVSFCLVSRAGCASESR